MSTEIYKSPLSDNKGWDVAVACDIQLSHLFNDRSRFARGSYIDIDPSAITSTLKSLEEESTGSILFEAVDLDTLNYTPGSETRLLGRYRKIGGIAVVNVGVAVALYSNIRGKTDPMSIRLVSQYGKHAWFDEYMKSSAKRDESSIQKTSVHELSHVVDKWDKELLSKTESHDEKYKPTQINKATNRLIDDRYLSDPSEIKARAAGGRADNYPQIISFKSDKNEHTTNIVSRILKWCNKLQIMNNRPITSRVDEIK